METLNAQQLSLLQQGHQHLHNHGLRTQASLESAAGVYGPGFVPTTGAQAAQSMEAQYVDALGIYGGDGGMEQFQGIGQGQASAYPPTTQSFGGAWGWPS
jgi:hypothetical protein